MTVNKDHFYRVIRPASWEVACDCARYLHAGWVFRGHSDATWKLSTTFERSAHRQGCDKLLPNRESWIIRQFTRRASHFVPDAPDDTNYLEWLALIQHHGGPTRLLDFTHSFYTAAFFAVETASSNSAVWAVNAAKLEDLMLTTLSIKKPPSPFQREALARQMVNEVVVKKATKRLVVAVEPHRMNERLAAQQGLFLFPTDISASFEANLTEGFGVSVDVLSTSQVSDVTNAKDLQMTMILGSVLKIIIPKGSHKSALDDLRAMNVTAATLFPGLDGFARSLHYHLSLFQQDDEFLKRYIGD